MIDCTISRMDDSSRTKEGDAPSGPRALVDFWGLATLATKGILPSSISRGSIHTLSCPLILQTHAEGIIPILCRWLVCLAVPHLSTSPAPHCFPFPSGFGISSR